MNLVHLIQIEIVYFIILILVNLENNIIKEVFIFLLFRVKKVLQEIRL